MKIFISIVVAALIVAGAWWWMEHPESVSNIPLPVSSSTAAQEKYAYVPGNLLLGTDATTTGKYLIASNGMTLYTFARDAGNVSSCTGLCTKTWPPYTISSREALSNIQAGIGGKVDAVTRGDNGLMQVTYDEQPLYFFSGDQVSGDTKGDGIGNLWSLARP